MELSRRDLLMTSACGLTLLPRLGYSEPRDPHFMIFVKFDGGWDPASSFDGRPKSMIEAKLIHPYGGEPKPWADNRGGTALISPYFETLAPLRDYFSIVNGVLMAKGFDGHEQNSNYLLTGNPFGGRSFLPLTDSDKPLTLITTSVGYENVNNHDTAIALNPSMAKTIADNVSLKAAASRGVEFGRAHRDARIAHDDSGDKGAWSYGVRRMKSGVWEASDLGRRFHNLDLGELPPDEPFSSTLKMIEQIFRVGITGCVMIQGSLLANSFLSLDAHNAGTASSQPETYPKIAKIIYELIDFLRSTPGVDSTNQSLLDQTTVAVSSEFGRTMRQYYMPYEQTGTDHNPLSNTVVLAGKGIKTGLIFGGSDFRHESETLSPVHLALDAQKVSTMGRVIDKSTGLPRNELPHEFHIEDYLSYQELGVSLMKVFNIPENEYWESARGVKAKPFLPILR